MDDGVIAQGGSQGGHQMADDLAVAVGYLKQWKFSSPTKPGELLPKLEFTGPKDRNYWLKNSQVRKFLQHEKQTYGINLGWTDDAEPSTAKKVTRWFLARNGTSDSPLKYAETLALGNGNQPSWVRHEVREFGIDLAYAKTPAFEWRILGGEVGKPIDPNEYAALYNTDIDEFLIFFDRNVGGDLGWPNSERWEDQIDDYIGKAVKKYAKKAYADFVASK
jgi:hypothetical protein